MIKKLGSNELFALAHDTYYKLPYRKRFRFLKDLAYIVLKDEEAELHSIGDDYVKIIYKR